MSVGYIYKIDFPNGKHYIGLTTTSLEQRKKEHKKCAKSGDIKCLYNALRKYNMIETFELIEIDTADTLEDLCKKECEYIQKYNSHYIDGNGYNMTYGGEGVIGYVFTEEQKQKASELTKKYFENQENRKKQSDLLKNYNKENPHSGINHGEKMKQIYIDNPELREKMSVIKKKFYDDNPEKVKELSEKRNKYFENPENRKKCSESQKKRFLEPETRKENGKLIKQIYIDNPELREKMSVIKKKFYDDNPEKVKEFGERMKNYFKDNPETKQQILDKKGKNLPFDIFTKDETFIKTFNYQFEAKEYLQKVYNITSTIKIGAVLDGKRKSSAGFIFKYK